MSAERPAAYPHEKGVRVSRWLKSMREDAWLLRFVRWAIPRTLWTVIERDGRSEFVIWRQWRGRAYDINSIAALPGRYDRETEFGRLDPYPLAHRTGRIHHGNLCVCLGRGDGEWCDKCEGYAMEQGQ